MTFAQVAAEAAVLVLVAAVVAGGSVVAAVVTGEAVVAGGSVVAVVVTGGAVAVVAAGDVEVLDEASEHAASTPSTATAIAAERLTWRSRHRSTVAMSSPTGRAHRR